MSGIVNKVKNALHSDNTSTSTSTPTTGTHAGTHTTGTTHTTGAPEGVAGHHNTRAANAADPRIDSDLDGSRNLGAAHNTTHGTHGTHGTTHTGTSGLTGTSHSTTGGSGLTGHSTQNPNTTGITGAGHSGNTTAGPHKSDLLNQADPRIDSDLSKTGGHAHTVGGAQGTHNNGLTGNHTSHTTGGGLTGAHNTTHTTGSGLTGSHNTGLTGTGAHNTTHTTGAGLTGSSHPTSHTTTAGPHSNNLLNKADPTVDSDLSKATHGRDHTVGNTHTTTGHNTGLTGSSHTGAHNTSGLSGTHVGNTHGTHTGTTGGLSSSTNAGPHNANIANKADPRVDSDLDGRGNRHGAATGGVLGTSGSHATPGSGTAQNTAGPHNSDLLNKLDPRVDSNLDGSKTVGGNATHKDSTSYAHKDVHDASQVPPSVFAAHKGEPEILHGDYSHDRAGRHGSLSHQEKHSGI